MLNGQVHRFSLTVFLLTFLCSLFASSEVEVKCPICGMKISVTSKTSFESARQGKPFLACSFSCISRFSKNNPEAILMTKDFLTAQKIQAKSAYFLIKSKKLLKEIEFDMPPSVVAFKSELDAQKTKKRLGDGEVIHGYDALVKVYE